MISASLVVFNNRPEMVRQVIDSFAPFAARHLYILDNAPGGSKGLAALSTIEGITYEMMGQNLGYGRAHNKGIERAVEEGSEFHVILNPDLFFDSSVIDSLAQYARCHDDVVSLMPKIVYPDGTIQYLCKLLPTPADLLFRRFFPDWGPFRKANDRYTLKSSGYDHVMNPPCLSGCFMFLRTKTLKEEQLRFDERFFMYCEDFDLIRRLHRIGKTIYDPEVTVVHRHARESYHNKKMLMMHIRSVCKYFSKYGWFFDREREEMNRAIKKEISAFTNNN